MAWIDRVPFPVVVGALAAGLAAGVALARIRFGLLGYVVTLGLVGVGTGTYLLDYQRRPAAARTRRRPPTGPPASTTSPAERPPVSAGTPVETMEESPEAPFEPIPDDLSDEEDPVLEADRLSSSPGEENTEGPPPSAG